MPDALADAYLTCPNTLKDLICKCITNREVTLEMRQYCDNVPALCADSADRAAMAPSIPPVAVSSCIHQNKPTSQCQMPSLATHSLTSQSTLTLHYIKDLVSTYNIEQQTLQCHTIDAR